jgi:hypothetical protein
MLDRTNLTNKEKAVMELLDALEECATFYLEFSLSLKQAADNLKARIARAKELTHNES